MPKKFKGHSGSTPRALLKISIVGKASFFRKTPILNQFQMAGHPIFEGIQMVLWPRKKCQDLRLGEGGNSHE